MIKADKCITLYLKGQHTIWPSERFKDLIKVKSAAGKIRKFPDSTRMEISDGAWIDIYRNMALRIFLKDEEINASASIAAKWIGPYIAFLKEYCIKMDEYTINDVDFIIRL